jgi:hypothetical protein
LDAHIANCPYEAIKGFVTLQDKAINQLKKQMKDKDKENKVLKETVSKMNQQLDTLADNFAHKTGLACKMEIIIG